MRTEEEIKLELKSYEESLSHREKDDFLDMLIGASERGFIDALKWVLESEE